MNDINLQLLADKIRTIPQKDFHMGAYRAIAHDYTNNGISEAEFISPTDCGTIGCALGHAPLIKGLEPIKSDFYETQVGLNYRIYCERVFGIKGEECNWNWCFSSDWQYGDNTPKGAAERIEYLIKHGKPPIEYHSEGYCEEH